MKVLITGISGALGRMVAEQLLEKGHQLIGIDKRPWPDAPPDLRMYRTDIRKRPAEDVFRTHRPDAMIHMATVTHFSTRSEERFRINLGGTRRIFEHCHNYGVKHAIFVGRHTVYGASADGELYHTEADPPMAASSFPKLSDLVAADLYASSALWRFPELRTVILRIVYTLGPSRRGTLANFLSGRRIPGILGFDPLFHLMHERDAVKAIVMALEDPDLRGVYNVAGPPPVPLSLLAKVVGKPLIPLPVSLFRRLRGRWGFPRLPEDVVEHLKYPIVVDASPFKEATGFEHTYDERQTMESMRWAF